MAQKKRLYAHSFIVLGKDGAAQPVDSLHAEERQALLLSLSQMAAEALSPSPLRVGELRDLLKKLQEQPGG